MNLLSDAAQSQTWPEIAPLITKGKTLYFSHGFSVVYKDDVSTPLALFVPSSSPRKEGDRIFSPSCGLTFEISTSLSLFLSLPDSRRPPQGCRCHPRRSQGIWPNRPNSLQGGTRNQRLHRRLPGFVLPPQLNFLPLLPLPSLSKARAHSFLPSSLLLPLSDVTGKAMEKAQALSVAVGTGYSYETTFEKEVYSDLYGERGVVSLPFSSLSYSYFPHLPSC